VGVAQSEVAAAAGAGLAVLDPLDDALEAEEESEPPDEPASALDEVAAVLDEELLRESVL
jgi:hypothetical protein